MWRTLHHTLAVAVLTVALGASLLWPRTHVRSDELQWMRPSGGVHVRMQRGAVMFAVHSHNYAWSAAWWHYASEPASSAAGQPVGTAWHAIGFSAGTSGGTHIMGGLRPMVSEIRFVVIPCWALTLGAWTVAWPVLRTHPFRRTRTKPGRCESCGYDLRATPHQCPECGRAVTMPPQLSDPRFV